MITERRLNRFLPVLGGLARRYGVWLVLSAVLLTIPILTRALRVQMDMDVAALFPANDACLNDFAYFSREFGFTDLLVLVDKDKSAESLQKMAALRVWLEASGHMKAVHSLDYPGSPKGEMLLAFPRRPATDHAFSSKMVADIEQHLAETGTSASVTGGAALATEGMTALQADLRRTVIVAFAAILFVIAVIFGDPLFPFIAAVPLGIGILWTLVFAHFAFGSVNILTASLPTTLMGIGVDYGLYLSAARQEFKEMAHHEHAWESVFARVALPMLIGALATASAFFSLAFAHLRGFTQMGYVGGFGVLVVFALSMVLMPVLIDRRERIGFHFNLFDAERTRRMAHAIVRHRVIIISVFIAVTIPLFICATKIRFDNDPSSYQDPHLKSLVLYKQLVREKHISLDPILIATKSIAAERSVLQDVRRNSGEDGEYGFVDSLAQELDLSMDLKTKLLKNAHGEYGMVIFPKHNPYEGDNLDRLSNTTAEIRQRHADDIVAVSGNPLLWKRMMTLTYEDMARTGIAATIFLVIVLLLLVRHPGYYFSTMIPLAGGIIWMLGTVQLMGGKFGIANAVVSPLILGMGNGYGVYIVHRLRTTTVEKAVATTGRAVLASALTTAGAFFALCAANNKGLVSMGLTAGIGVTSCLIWSMLFLPALLGKLRHEHEGLPHHEAHP